MQAWHQVPWSTTSMTHLACCFLVMPLLQRYYFCTSSSWTYSRSTWAMGLFLQSPQDYAVIIGWLCLFRMIIIDVVKDFFNKLNRTEQLRKLGILQSYFLDQFNQKESSYATSNGCKTALQSELWRGGSLLPGFMFLGYVQVTWLTLGICLIILHEN